MTCYRVLIGEPKKEIAQKIVSSLIEKRLIASSLINNGESTYRWEDKVETEDYHSISAFTNEKNKEKIIEEVKKISKENVPVIAFFKIDDGNPDFLKWIEEN